MPRMLTKRQMETSELVAAGLSNKEIARELGVTQNTVRETLHKVFLKLNITNRAQLAVWAHCRIGMHDHDRYDQ